MIQVNGAQEPLEGLATVADLLARKGWKAAQVAVEHNGAILRREDFAAVPLSDGDRLEVVRFVGGG